MWSSKQTQRIVGNVGFVSIINKIEMKQKPALPETKKSGIQIPIETDLYLKFSACQLREPPYPCSSSLQSPSSATSVSAVPCDLTCSDLLPLFPSSPTPS